MEMGLAATLVWTQPDGTRCWIARQSERVIVAVSRESTQLRIELCEGDSKAIEWADAWRREYAPPAGPIDRSRSDRRDPPPFLEETT
jgi:hypothetical protein